MSATLQNPLHDLLKETFGFDHFRPGQQPVVEQLLGGNSALAVFPTGGGKSLCYQLPALMLEGMTLVVSPLIALMKDQIDFLVSKGVKAARMDSSLSGEESRAVWDALWKKELKLLYVAPERFASERFLQRMKRSRISMMVIDEAHCISEWGHNFRPDYMKLSRLARDLKVERVLCLTATATPAVAEDICRSFDVKKEAYVNTGFHRPNLWMRVRACSRATRRGELLSCLRDGPAGPAVVYVTLQKTAEEVAGFLSREGIEAEAYHAGLNSEVRSSIQDRFMGSSDRVVVATIAFGMGIDKADIRQVIHYNPPKSLENYMQETGRAGRDGLPSTCSLLVCPEDIATLENFSFGDTPDLDSLSGLLEEVCAQPDTFDISTYDLSFRYDIRPLVLSTLLTYLELEGVLISLGPRYNEYKFQPCRSSAEILATFDSERARFLKKVFAQAKKGKTWFTLDITQAAERLGEDRQRIVSAFNYLEEKGELVLKVAGLRHQYRFGKRPESVRELARQSHQRFQESERRDIQRIQQVVALAETPDCTVRQILSYFGEDLKEDCGHCDRCAGEAIMELPTGTGPVWSEDDTALVENLKRENHEALKRPRQLARFLCGLTSPASSRARLTKDSRFGSLSHMRFDRVLKHLMN